MPKVSYDIFISYRRDTGVHFARNIKKYLEEEGYRVFMDLDDLHAGKFNEQLYEVIDSVQDFIVLLTKGSLDRCHNEGDWVRKEICYAIKVRKNILPFVDSGFTFPEALPEDLQELPQYQGVRYNPEQDAGSMSRLKGMLSAKPSVNVRRGHSSDQTDLKKLQILLQKRLWTAAEKVFSANSSFAGEPEWMLSGLLLKYHCATSDELAAIQEPLEPLFADIFVVADEPMVELLTELIEKQKKVKDSAKTAVEPEKKPQALPEQKVKKLKNVKQAATRGGRTAVYTMRRNGDYITVIESLSDSLPKHGAKKRFADIFSHINDDCIFIAPEIPPKKLNNAIASYAPEIKADDVIVLVDDTVWGGAKEGMIVTEKKLFGKELLESPVAADLSPETEISLVNEKEIYVDGRKIISLLCIKPASLKKLVAAIRTMCKT